MFSESQVIFIYIAPNTIQIISKQLQSNKHENNSGNIILQNTSIMKSVQFSYKAELFIHYSSQFSSM